MLNIVKNENIILSQIERAQMDKKDIFIYGCGEVGKNIYGVLSSQGITVKAFCVDEDYFVDGKYIESVPIESLENIVSKCINENRKAVIIVAFRGFIAEKLSKYNELVEVINEDIVSLMDVNGYPRIDYAFIDENRKLFEQTYSWLEDKKSKQCMSAFLNQKISGKFGYLSELWDNNQYFAGEIIDFNKINAIIDCGAYNGDSYLSFLDNYEKNVGHKYGGKAYLLEPDKENYNQMCHNCKKIDNCEMLNIGAWSKKEVLTFSNGNGTSSGIDENGSITIEVDCIDHFAEGKVDFIKMDIEGSEMEALKGAEETIKRDHPILAICVYHKREDLITIPNYIKSLCENYKFYLRIYTPYSQELVLYAVCK